MWSCVSLVGGGIRTMKRIIFTIANGQRRFAEMAIGLAMSLAFVGDDSERVVITDIVDAEWKKHFGKVLQPTAQPEMVYFSKLTALDRTDADQVLFVDSDSLAFKRTNDIFDYCAGRGFAVQGALAVEGSWYGQIADHLVRHGIDAMPKFNGGMIYYERTPEAQAFLRTCMEYGARAKEFGFQRDDPLIPDEPCISLAMQQTGYGHLIPPEMDFMSTGPGIIGKLQMDILKKECKFISRQEKVRFVEPYIFHAAAYSSFFIYWHQIDQLKALEPRTGKRPPGHVSGWLKLRRSLERRYMKQFAREIVIRLDR